jgi:hypothetical protein
VRELNMTAKKDDTLYVRNGRPNILVIHFDGNRIPLGRRGARDDSTSLRGEAANDPTISRFLKQGLLEKISRDSFMKLGARQIDIEPNQFLKRQVRDGRTADVIMHPAEADTTRSASTLRDVDIRKAATPKLEWSGDLMSTEEELEEMDYSAPEHNYPSHHRDSDEAVRRQMGY